MKAEARARPVKNGQAFKALLCSTKGAKVFLSPVTMGPMILKLKWVPGMRDREGPDLSLTFQPRKGWELWIRAAQDPFLGNLQLQSPYFNFLPGTPPLPHLAIYCCNLLTSKMLHNRPHLGQGEFPGSSPPLGGAPWGPGAERNPLYPPITRFPPGAPGWALSIPFANTSGGMGYICFI